MGCFLQCFGGEKDSKRRKRRGSRGSPQRQRNRIQNAQQENYVTAEQSIKETNSINLDSQLRNKLEEVEQLSLNPEDQIAINSNITTHEHVSGRQSTDFQPEVAISTDKETQQDLKTSSPPHSASGDDGSVTSSAGSYASNLKNKSKGTKQLSPSPKKRVTFNSNVTTYEHVSVNDSTDFQEDLKTPSQSYSVSEDEGSVASSVGSYPPNHRYHNARDSDDEAEEYGDSDLDHMDGDDEDYYDDDYDEDDIDVRITGQKVWSESVLTASMESRTGNPSPQGINEEVDSPMVEPQPFNNELEAFTSKTYARDRSNYINSVLNPVGNTTQWKAVKSRGQQHLKKPAQKENLVDDFVASEPPTFGRTKYNKPKISNQEIAVDASLSTWLSSPEVTPSKKTMSGECVSVKSFEDRPILGAWTVDELRQVSKSASPRKSPSRSPDETPIIGTVGTYWNHLGSAAAKHSDLSFKGIPNTTSKYREDKRVNWHSTPFEKRLDQAISRGAAAEA